MEGEMGRFRLGAVVVSVFLVNGGNAIAQEIFSDGLMACPDLKTDQPEAKDFKEVPTGDYRIEQRGPMLFVGPDGMPRVHASTAIPEAWQRFIDQLPNIQNKAAPAGEPEATYGLCFQTEKGSEIFHYVPAAEVTNLDNIPSGFVGVVIPPRTYAVHTYQGPAEGMKDFRFSLTSQFWPQNDIRADAPNFEYYGPEFDPQSSNNKIEMWTPIKQ